MGRIVVRNQPCVDMLSCGSSDARQIYENGTSFCFSCARSFDKQANEVISTMKSNPSPQVYQKMLTIEEIKILPKRGFKERLIKAEVAEHFGVSVSYNEDGVIDAHYYPYGEGSYKRRKLPKEFTWIGTAGGLFGKDKFNGGGRRLIITEGEIDAMSIAQASLDKYKKIYPVIALSSSTATKSLIEARDWIRSFKEVVLCFDEDEAGEAAKKEAIKIIGLDKVKITKLPHKDANEVLVKDGGEKLLQSVFDAAPHIPSGIMTKEALWDALVAYNLKESIPYPACLEGLNSKLKGIRENEIVLYISGTGAGKSSMVREIVVHLLEITDARVGILSLEESPQEIVRKYAGLALSKNPAYAEISNEELRPGFDKIFGDDRLCVYNHGEEKDVTIDAVLNKMEYMALMGCRYIFLDPITMLVAEGTDNQNSNEVQDYLMNGLSRLVKRYPLHLGLVSHLRKTQVGGKAFEEGHMPSLDDIKGSGSVKQISFDIVAFARNSTAESDIERNTIRMRVLKSRYSGLTGDVRGVVYNYETGRLHAGFDGREEFVKL
jgi:twinkle protein